MIKYFQIKNRTGRCAEIYYREKVNTEAKPTIEKYIKKSQSIAIVGQANSGKTRQLNKFIDSSKIIWTRKKSIFFDSIAPLSQWLDNKDLAEFAKQNNKDYKGLKQYEKVNLLKKFCQEKRPFLLYTKKNSTQ